MKSMRLFALVLLFATACATANRQPQRLQQAPGGPWLAHELETQLPSARLDSLSATEQAALRGSSLERYDDFDLGIIEFRDTGLLWSIQQARLVLDHVGEEAMKRGATVVVFVHGWHHGAKVDDPNLVSFRHVLRTISHQDVLGERCTDKPPLKNRLIGIYIGWRGESSENALGKWLTIWNRKRAAQRIGGATTPWQRLQVQANIRHASQFPDILTELDDIRIRANELPPDPQHRTFTSLVYVGHSLGGAMLLSAMQQLTFENRLAGTSRNPARRMFRGIGDVVVLLNPAIEARRYRDFSEIAQSGRRFADEQAPVLLTISSDGDTANRRLFRISRILNSIFWPPRWFEFHDSITALGFADSVQTHRLTLENAKVTFPPLDQFSARNYYPSCAKQDEQGRFQLKTIRLASDQCSYGPLVQTTTSRGLDPNTPFMVVRTSNDIITDHNNIFTSAMVSYLVPFVSAAERKNVLGRCGGMTDPEPLTASVSAEK